LKVIRTRDEVALAVHLDEHPELGPGMNVRADDALAGLAVRPLRRLGESLLPKILDRRLQVALGGLQGVVAVHHTRSGELAELPDQLGGSGHRYASPLAATT